MHSANFSAPELEELLEDLEAAVAQMVVVVEPTDATPGDADELPPQEASSILNPRKTDIPTFPASIDGFHHPHGSKDFFDQSARTPHSHGSQRLIQRTWRHTRQPFRTPRGGIRSSAALRSQRVTRTSLTRERTLVQVALGDLSTSDVWKLTAADLLASNREQETLIEALLTLASSESGIDHREYTNLEDLCNTVLARLDLETDRPDLNIEAVLDPAPLMGDPRLIEPLIANLVDDASEHNILNGRIQISSGLKEGKASFSITNTGPVVAPSEIKRLFQPFQRLDGRRTNRRRGHGLGLSIVRAIADAHDAGITTDSSPGGGLSIGVTIPRITSQRHATRGALEISSSC